MQKKFKSKKSIALLVSMVLVLTMAVGTTLAYLIDVTDPLPNIFAASKVTVEVEEEFENNVKSNVTVKNTGDTTAYIRAAVVITWQNEHGDVYGKMPVAGADYQISYNLNAQTNPVGQWFEKDGFYYWNSPVEAKQNTGILIARVDNVVRPADVPSDYYLCVEILASGVQSDGVNFTNTKAVVDAWGIDPSTLS